MVTPELMLTNHHVFPVATAAEFAAFADDAAIERLVALPKRARR